jgi:hypothetical protein
MEPPHLTLDWDQVVNYACLSDFYLLRESQQDICEKKWATPAAHLLMDQYFKLQQAHKEIQHLNIEIHHVITHLQDEERFLLAKESEIQKTNPALAFQV